MNIIEPAIDHVRDLIKDVVNDGQKVSGLVQNTLNVKIGGSDTENKVKCLFFSVFNRFPRYDSDNTEDEKQAQLASWESRIWLGIVMNDNGTDLPPGLGIIVDKEFVSHFSLRIENPKFFEKFKEQAVEMLRGRDMLKHQHCEEAETNG